MSESGIRFIDPPVPNESVLAYEILDGFTADDMRAFIERLEKISASGHKALLYQDMVHRGSFDFDTIELKLANMGMIWNAIEKVAVIGDSKWLEVYIGLADHLTPQKIRYFEAHEKDEAFAWLTS